MVRTGDKQGPKRTIRNGTRVLVRDLPEKVRKTSLQSAFGDFGDVVRIEARRHCEGRKAAERRLKRGLTWINRC